MEFYLPQGMPGIRHASIPPIFPPVSRSRSTMLPGVMPFPATSARPASPGVVLAVLLVALLLLLAARDALPRVLSTLCLLGR